MPGCVQSHALLSALVSRIERESFVPPESDLEALLALGISRPELAAAFGRIQSDAAREAMAALARVADRPPKGPTSGPSGRPSP